VPSKSGAPKPEPFQAIVCGPMPTPAPLKSLTLIAI